MIWGRIIPNDIYLLGWQFFNQAFFLDPGANPAGMIATNGGSGIVGR